jgi:DNA polymerase-3 subunit beta
LTGALFSLNGDLTLASSDGFRLAVQVAKVGENAPDARVIMPGKVLAIAQLIIGLVDADEQVWAGISPHKNQIAFSVANMQTVGQLIDGNFPDYNQIVPKNHRTRVVVGVSELTKALKMASVFARESSNIVRFDLAPGSDVLPGSIKVSAVSAETGDGQGEVDATVEGEPLTIAFNVKYFLDALSHLGTAQAEIRANDPASPALVRPVGDNGHLAVVMPMHLTAR